MDKQLGEVESLCLNGMRKGDVNMVEKYFGPYLAYKPNTSNSGFIKAYMLLHYLSSNMKKAFYTTLETVTPEELKDKNIMLVMNVERYINIGMVEKLKRLVGSNSTKEFNPFLNGILEHQKKTIESCPEDKSIYQDQNYKKIISDSMFIGRNSSTNF